jgi:hypothetical protein
MDARFHVYDLIRGLILFLFSDTYCFAGVSVLVVVSGDVTQKRNSEETCSWCQYYNILLQYNNME